MEVAFASVIDLCSDFGDDLDPSLVHRLAPLSLCRGSWYGMARRHHHLRHPDRNHDIAHAKGGADDERQADARSVSLALA